MDRLHATVQHYAWGDPTFIPRLQGRVATGEPEAELWMGAHPAAPSRLFESQELLSDVIAADPVAALGAATAETFGQLPFLAKILAAAQPLSIQTHPSRSQARAGFERENASGVPLQSPARVYRDPNHKPELICALTPLELKSGFRGLDVTRELFASLGEPAQAVTERLGAEGPDGQVLGDVLQWLLRLPATEAAALVHGIVDASTGADARPFEPDLSWSDELNRIHPGDVGVVVVLLLNHLVLAPGQALFLEAGNLHAYLRGAGVELMANSDNVVRCGLTTKHVDPEELLRVVDTSPSVPEVQSASTGTHVFAAPVAEFALARMEVHAAVAVDVEGPEVLLVTQGELEFTPAEGSTISVSTGQPVWVPASDRGYRVSGHGTLFRATVGGLADERASATGGPRT